jgi:DNA polymerase-3 subunit alpha
MAIPFVHLRVRSEFSIVNSVVRLKPLVKAVAAASMPAVALTDRVNLFGAVKFYRAAESAGVKPIIGVELLLSQDPSTAARGLATSLLLLATNRVGYLNLTDLISRSYVEGQHLGLPLANPSWLDGLDGRTDGLIALSGGRLGDVGQALLKGDRDQARERLLRWCDRFPNRFYVEIQRTGRPQEEVYLQDAVDLAIQCDVPVVATNDVHFLKPQDFEVHETRVCIAEGRVLDDPQRSRSYSDQQYLRTPAEMAELFSDVPAALRNSFEIAKRCNVTLNLGNAVLPTFPVPASTNESDYLRAGARAGLTLRLNTIAPAEQRVE